MTSETHDPITFNRVKTPVAGRREVSALGGEPNRVRLQTLVVLRWIAVGGQLTTVLIVDVGFGFALPLGMALATIAASAWLNIFLTIRYPSTIRLQDRQAALYLGYDILQLAALLYLTGGLSNPFAILLLVPVTISATNLSLRSTALLLCLAFVCVSLLAMFHLPLPWRAGQPFAVPTIYIAGVWVALVAGLAFMAAYARRIAEEQRRLSAALAATQLVLAREQRLSALDGLAAAAAHELGTPLGTITVIAKELQRTVDGDEEVAEDLALLRSQAERCREILSTLTAAKEGDAVHKHMHLGVLLEEVAAPARGLGPEIAITVEAEREGDEEPVIWRRPEILYGLGNLVDNAVDFAESEVKIAARFGPNRIRLTIIDDGEGFKPEIIDRLGEPYVTTRPKPATADEHVDEHEGMGLGFFIAKTLLERTGADVAIANRAGPEHGALVIVDWPRDAIESQPPSS